MPRLKSANLAKTTLQTGCSPSDTSITVTSSSGFPNAPFRIFVGNQTTYEIMEVTDVTGTTWTVTRAQEGTSAQSFDAGTSVENRFTHGTYDELVSGPESATDGNLAVFDGTTGKILKDGGTPLSLGETSTTAYRGDRGKEAYDHSQSTSGSVHGSTTVGGALLRLTDPSEISFIKINSDDSVSTRAATDFLNDIGAMPISGGTFTGKAYAQNNTDYTTGQLRNVFVSTSNPDGGGNGDVWIKYTA